MEEITYFCYEGDLPLGSVVAHSCGAAGLFSRKDKYDLFIKGSLEGDYYYLTLLEEGKEGITWTSDGNYKGRKELGRLLLSYLRERKSLAPSPWGSLVGVRPLKLYHKEKMALGEERAEAHLSTTWQVRAEKLKLLRNIAKLQEPYITRATENPHAVSVYGGIPFCTTRCSYCSFPYGLIQDFSRLPAFQRAFLRDIENLKALIDFYGLTVDSLYLGGGTPTSLGEEAFKIILETFASFHQGNREFTVEAGRPDTVTLQKLQAMKAYGVNRISINPQTLQDSILKSIGRYHDAASIEELYHLVRKETTFSVNMDFIAGLPGQSFSHMMENMEAVCQWRPENVTIHTLALKKGSPLYEQRNCISLPSAEEVQAMTSLCQDMLEAAGYVPYYLYRQQYMTGQLENIGYTLPGKESLYNIQMMEERQNILSVGPGSSTKLMRAPSFKQNKQHLPKDVNVYIDTLEALMIKRSNMFQCFYGSELENGN